LPIANKPNVAFRVANQVDSLRGFAREIEESINATPVSR
jgi:hypothetical protein